MNNKGFTLIEVIITLVMISLLTITISGIINKTLASSKEETYKIMKKNIVTASHNYINECKAKTIDCNFSYDDNNVFYAKVLEENGYFKNLKSPIDEKYLGNCLKILVTYDNGTSVIDIEDNCY